MCKLPPFPVEYLGRGKFAYERLRTLFFVSLDIIKVLFTDSPRMPHTTQVGLHRSLL